MVAASRPSGRGADAYGRRRLSGLLAGCFPSAPLDGSWKPPSLRGGEARSALRSEAPQGRLRSRRRAPADRLLRTLPRVAFSRRPPAARLSLPSAPRPSLDGLPKVAVARERRAVAHDHRPALRAPLTPCNR